jgi:hypothetical protein
MQNQEPDDAGAEKEPALFAYAEGEIGRSDYPYVFFSCSNRSDIDILCKDWLARERIARENK